tara:strand:+ start:2081 stop:3460 length:1380 start_codon:yes stop_codon:yes gene_type:complete
MFNRFLQPTAVSAVFYSMARHIFNLTLVLCSISVSLVVYSTVNDFFWEYFLDYIAQFHQGTVKKTDVVPWVQDLAQAWSNDLVYSDFGFVADRLIRLPFGLVIDKDVFLPQGTLWITVGLVVFGWIGTYAVPMLANRFSASAKHTGLSESFINSQEIQQDLQKIQNRSMLFAFSLMPFITASSWYITYDRMQSSWTDSNGKTRYARYISESFHPLLSEWVVIVAIPFIIGGLLIVVFSNRFIKNIPVKNRVEQQRYCLNRKCKYEIDQEISICPECGLNWKESIRKSAFSLMGKRIKNSAIAIGILCFLAIAVILIRSPNQRYRWHNWLTLRSERFLQQQITLVPNRPVNLRWGNEQVWMVIVDIDPSKPNNGYRIIYKINAQSPAMFSDVDNESDFIELKKSKVIKMQGEFYISLSPPPTPYITIPILVTPDDVKGFPNGDSLSQEAQAFLDYAKDMP